MTPEEYKELPEQSKKFYCQDHCVPKVKDAHGNFTCLFCEKEDSNADGQRV